MEKELGRQLRPGEVVHHKNGVKDDNRPANLEVMRSSDHSKKHARPKTLYALECPECGKSFQRSRQRVTARRRANQRMFCSRECRNTNTKRALSNRQLKPVIHGTLAGYFRCLKPRCSLCLKAMREYSRRRRRKQRS